MANPGSWAPVDRPGGNTLSPYSPWAHPSMAGGGTTPSSPTPGNFGALTNRQQQHQLAPESIFRRRLIFSVEEKIRRSKAAFDAGLDDAPATHSANLYVTRHEISEAESKVKQWKAQEGLDPALPAPDPALSGTPSHFSHPATALALQNQHRRDHLTPPYTNTNINNDSTSSGNNHTATPTAQPSPHQGLLPPPPRGPRPAAESTGPSYLSALEAAAALRLERLKATAARQNEHIKHLEQANALKTTRIAQLEAAVGGGGEAPVPEGMEELCAWDEELVHRVRKLGFEECRRRILAWP